MTAPLQTDAVTAAALFRGGALLLDAREPWELALAQVAGATPIPMQQVPARLSEIPGDRQVLVLCHHGARSARVTQFLRAQGRDNVTNVAGGIEAWALEVDSSLPRY